MSTAAAVAKNNATAEANSKAATDGPGSSLAVSNSLAKADANTSTVVSQATAEATSTKDHVAVSLVKATADSQHVDVRCKGVALDNHTIEHCPKADVEAHADATALAKGNVSTRGAGRLVAAGT